MVEKIKCYGILNDIILETLDMDNNSLTLNRNAPKARYGNAKRREQ